MIKKIGFFLLAFNFFIILNSSPIAPPVEDLAELTVMGWVAGHFHPGILLLKLG